MEEKKNRTFGTLVLHVPMFLILLFLSVAQADTFNSAAEGYIQQTEKSATPFNLTNLLPLADAINDLTIVVNPFFNNFPDISAFTTVLDVDGNPVYGLDETTCSLTEQSSLESAPTTETISNMVSTYGGGISFALVFDVSGSMGDLTATGTRLSDAQQAAESFINQTQINDRGALIKFNNVAEIVQNSDWVTVDANANGIVDLIEAVNNLSAGGYTAVYDGTALGIDAISQEPTPKAVIVFTDGQTNSDQYYDINTVIAKAITESVPIYTIGLEIDPQNLKDMAASTGGQYYYAPSAADMAAIYLDISESVRSQYRIDYTTHNPVFDGTTRVVTVTCDNGLDTGTGSGIYTVNYKPVIERDAVTVALSNVSQVSGIPLTISGSVFDLDADLPEQALELSLYYRHVGDANYTQVTRFDNDCGYIDACLIDQGNGKYDFSFTIPGGSVTEPGLDYYLVATDTLLNTYAPVGYQNNPYVIPVLDNHAPQITHTPIVCGDPGQDVAITAEIIDPDLGGGVTSATLYYRIHDPLQTQPYHAVIMANTTSNTWEADIPGMDVGSEGVDYYISAWDNDAVRADHGTAEAPHYFVTDCGTTTVFSTDFEDGWGLWYPDNGVWEIGTPTSGPNACHSGSQCAATILDGNYPSGPDSRLTSPTITLPTVTGPEELHLRFWHWFSIEGHDAGYVQIQVWDSDTSTWSEWTTEGTTLVNTSDWSIKDVDITAYIGKTVRIGFFHSEDGYYGTSSGWYIDDIEIIAKVPAFDGDFEDGWGDWGAGRGVWQIGTPTSGPGACHSGSQCAATILDGNYPGGTDSRLTSPTITLPTVTGPEELHLRFWHWFSIEGHDAGYVQIQVWDSDTSTWSGWTTEGTTLVNTSDWSIKDVDITAYAGETVRIGFFHSEDGYYGTGSGWYIDDIEIIAKVPAFDGDFEDGWGDWGAGRGVWQIGTPTSGPGACHSGSQCAATILDGNYPGGTDSRLTSPTITLPTVIPPQELQLRYWHWYSIEGHDPGSVQIQVWDANTALWGGWDPIGIPVSGSSINWTFRVLDISAYAGETVRIGFFHSEDGYYGTSSGWYIDDICIYGMNCLPIAISGGPYIGNEGASIVLDGSDSYDNDGIITDYHWDLEGDGVYDDASGVSTSITYPDNGIYTIGLQVTDNGGLTDVDTTTITIYNVDPVVDAGPDVVLGVDGVFNGSGSFVDPGADTWTATVNYGDGSGVQPLTLTGKTFNLNHTFVSSATPYTVTVCVNDKDEGGGCDGLMVTTTGSADPDTDGDGLPDSWEETYGLDPLDPTDANSDLDLDGLTALEEYLAGTQPNNPDSDADGRIDGLDSDPLVPAPNLCGGDSVVLINDVYATGTIFDCRAQVSIQTDGTVTVESGAEVLYMAPVLRLDTGFSVESGGVFHAVGATDVAP